MPSDEVRKVAGSDIDDRTLSDQISHTDDEGYQASRPSVELSEGDHDILESEDERERLLTKKDGISGLFNKKSVKIGKRETAKPNKAPKRARKKGRHGQRNELMYELEEGIAGSDASVSRNSSESDEQRLLATASQRKAC